jgi:serine/threonine protein kinase
LASRNVLLTQDLQPKICDFGFARALEKSEYQTKSNLGPYRIMAPESFIDRKFTKQSGFY